MVDINVVLLIHRCANVDLVLLEAYFWQACVFESENSSKEESINKVAIVINKLQLDCERPD